MIDVEATIWCPVCKENKGEVQRVPTGMEGVFVNKPVPDPMPKKCGVCNATLARRE
jgi:hypothetical protein